MVSRNDIQYVAKLSKISIEETDMEKYSKKLEEIISYLGKLDEIKSEDLVDSDKFVDASELRDDDPVKFDADPINTKYRKDGYIKGPKVI